MSSAWRWYCWPVALVAYVGLWLFAQHSGDVVLSQSLLWLASLLLPITLGIASATRKNRGLAFLQAVSIVVMGALAIVAMIALLQATADFLSGLERLPGQTVVTSVLPLCLCFLFVVVLAPLWFSGAAVGLSWSCHRSVFPLTVGASVPLYLRVQLASYLTLQGILCRLTLGHDTKALVAWGVLFVANVMIGTWVAGVARRQWSSTTHQDSRRKGASVTEAATRPGIDMTRLARRAFAQAASDRTLPFARRRK